MVGAIHIEIDERNYASNKEKLSRVYESKQTEGFPLGIKMQLCPQVQDATDPATSYVLWQPLVASYVGLCSSSEKN